MREDGAMSDMFDKIVEGAGQVISDVDKSGQIQSAIGGLRQRLADADRRRRLNQVKQELGDLQSEEAQSINALSAQVWALYEAGSLSQPELVSLCNGVKEVRVKIKAKEAELAQMQPAKPEPSAEELCPSCGVPIVAGGGFCQSCGTQLTPDEPQPPVLFCVHCGSQLRESARFCPKCGQTIDQS
jgi:hypothetical protein